MSREPDLSAGNESSLRNKISRYIKTQIINGNYKPGESLVESKLAEELGVSRTPIREAVRLLEQEGLVETTHNKGAVVIGISNKDVADIYAIRQLVEGLAVRWAAERINEQDKKELKKIFDLMEFYAARGDVDEVADLDNQFHHIIYEASGSRILNLTLSNLHQYVQLARLESLQMPNRLDKTLNEHRAILQNFLDNKPLEAEKAVVEHVRQAYLNIKEKSK
ncbi:MAG: GntR family transcriptional regulator [Clostridia bacterium]|jgi:DNA-binding GntR family transcriptional regulator|nr:GntR family transcriptional regulator [Clostridia bacterium]